jgi:hypothetical protein
MGFEKALSLDYVPADSTITITGAGLLAGQGGDLTLDRVFTLNNIDIDHNALLNTHNLTTDIDHDALLNWVADKHIDWTNTTENLLTTGTVDCSELFSSGASLKIMPNAQYDVNLFGDTDVGNDEDGKKFTVNRRAAEGDTYFRIFVNDDRVVWLDANWDISIRSNQNFGEIQLGNIPNNTVRLLGTLNAIGFGYGSGNLPLRHYGYITAGGLSGQKYVNWLLDDTDDYYNLTRSSTLVLGLKVNMPLNLAPDSTPASAIEGDIYADSGDHHLYFYNGTTWKQLDN